MIILLAGLLVAADPAIAQQPVTPAPAATAPKVAEKKICKIDENESSSRLRKRVCMTASEWDMKAQGKSADDLKTIGGR
jgi:hypothetical protein